MMIIISACNTAEQKPVPEKSSSNSSIGNIVDDIIYDQTVYFSRDSNSFTESNRTFNIILSRRGNELIANQNVNIEISGDAEASDYSTIQVNGSTVPVSGNSFVAMFSGTARNLMISITMLDDSIYELDEKLHFSVVPNGGDYATTSGKMHTIFIANDETPPVVDFVVTALNVVEGTSYPAAIQVQINHPSYEDISIPVYIKSSSTVNSTDHDFIDQIITIPAGSLSESVDLNISTDASFEVDEVLSLKLLAPTGALLSPVNNEFDITILQVGANFNLSIDNVAVAENGGTADLTLTLSNALDSDLIVPLAISSGGGNISASDYSISALRFEIPAGSTTSTITVTSLDDNIYEASEIITFTVADTYNADVGVNTLNMTITDAEVAPVISFQFGTLTTEENKIAYVPITITPATDETIVLNYTVAGTATVTSDYVLPPAPYTGIITVSPGQSIINLPINIEDDSVFDPNETITLNLTLASGPGAVSGVASSQLTIKEPGDLPVISIANSTESISEGASANISFSVSNPIETSMAVKLDISNSSALETLDFDPSFTTTGSCSYNAATEILTFSGSSTSCQLTVASLADAIYEFSEYFNISMRQPQYAALGTIFSKKITIADTNTKPTLKASLDSDETVNGVIGLSINEGNPNFIYFHLDTISGVDTIINYSLTGTATNSSDYELTTTGQAIIHAGDLTYPINLDLINDGVYEITTDTIIATVQPGTNYTVAAQAATTTTITEVTAIPSLQIVSATSFTGNPLAINENDVANINFKLSAPVEQDLRIYYTALDSTDAAYCGALPVTHQCATIADDSNEFNTLLSSGGYVIIPKGDTIATLSFLIDTDSLFEIDLLERINISIDATSIRATDGITNLDGTVAQFDPVYDFMDIDIDDIECISGSFFATPQFKTVSENIGLLKAKVNISSRSQIPVTYHVQIVQYADSGKNKADENDFNDLTANGTISGSTYSAIDLTPPTTFGALTYVNASDIIYEGLFTVPALADSADIELPIVNDILFEGTEQFKIKIIDDPAESTYNWGVNLANDTFLVSLLETTTAPTVTFDSAIVTNITEGNASQTDIQAAVNPDLTEDLATTDVDFIFNLTSVSQHLDLSFDISLSGTANNNHDVFATSSLYMKSDYYVNHPSTGIQIGNTTDYTAAYTSVTGFNVSIPAGSGFTSDNFTAFIAQDYQFESDTTKNQILAQIQNSNNIIIGSASSHTLTIDDDDAVPFIHFDEAVPATSKEYDGNIIKLYTTDDSLTFSGDEITEEDITLSSTVQATLRDLSTPPQATTSLTLTSATNYTLPYGASTTTLNLDTRTVASFVFDISATTNAQVMTAPTNIYYLASGPLSAAAALTSTINLDYDDLKAALSKDSEKITISAELKIYSHTCTYYRGLVSCFGNNRSGQLGRGTAAQSYGSLPGESVDGQTDVINLGTDQNGFTNYAKQLALGKEHSCALLASNKIVCWGKNTFGQLGRGNSSAAGIIPTQMGNGLVEVDLGITSQLPVSIHAMSDSTCTVLDDGTAKCWGKNNLGQLGIETIATVGTQSTHMGTNLKSVMIDSSETILQLSTGANHACVYLNGTSRKVRCWGDNSKGQLGLNSDLESVGKATGEMGSTNVSLVYMYSISQIELGLNHTCININPTSKTSFNTRCWGDNYYGQLGTGRLTRAGMYVKSTELSDYAAPQDACNYHKTSGNNCTSMIGKDQGDTSGDYISIDEMNSWGRSTTVNGILFKPNSFDSGNDSTDVNINYNQYAQLYYPTYDIAAGESYSCGVVHDSLGVGEAVTVRCWGSNYIFDGPDTVSTNQFDLGVLNNHGHSVLYNPSTDAYDGFMNSGTNASCWLGGSSYNSAVCDFISHFKMIGDDTIFGQVEDYYTNTLSGSLTIGFTDNFPNNSSAPIVASPVGLNHEMHANSQSKFDFGSLFGVLDDIKIYGGAHHVCSVPVVNGVTAGDNNKMRCWGANHVGQSGINWVEGAGCDPDIVGGIWSCGSGNGVTKTFNYSF